MPGPQNTSKLDPIDAVALGHVLMHARDIGLPMPVDVHLGLSVSTLGGPRIRLDMATLVDLAEWATYLEACIATEALTETVDHHSVEGQVLELDVRLITTVAYSPAVLASVPPIRETAADDAAHETRVDTADLVEDGYRHRAVCIRCDWRGTWEVAPEDAAAEGRLHTGGLVGAGAGS